MAVARIKRIQIVALSKEREKILSALEEAALVEVSISENEFENEEIKDTLKEKLRLVESKLAKINFLIRIQKEFINLKTKLIDSFLPPKTILKKSKFTNIYNKFPLEKLYAKTEDADVTLRDTLNKIKNLREQKKQLLPWSSLTVKLNELQSQNVNIRLATIKTVKEKLFIDNVSKSRLSHVNVVSRIDGFSYLAIFIHKSEVLLSDQTKGFNLEFIELANKNATVNETIENNDKQIGELEKIKINSLKIIDSLADYSLGLEVCNSFLSREQAKLNVENSLLHSEKTFVLNGWLQAKETDKVSMILNKTTNMYAVEYSDVTVEDNPPIVLENPKWMKPFESVTTLYGMPKYNEIDPTPLMAPFFLIFLGLAIGDVVYGLFLSIFCTLLQKSNRLAPGSKTFLGLFVYGGISAIFFGVITGSYMALDPRILPEQLKHLIVFDPLAQPALFLVITLLLGLAQLCFGLMIKFYEVMKDESILIALQTQLPPLVLLPSLALLIAKILGLTLDPLLDKAVVYAALGSSLGIVLFSAYEAKNIFSRLGIGLYNLYGMSAYLGDTISYGRIMALGLATFLIGSSINTIILGGAIFESLIVKVILAVTVLPVIHFLNLAINSIGAFVHPARLQYVEFFSKFFEGGGSRFKPFAAKTDSIILEQES